MSLSGKVAAVTGGGSGIGEATCVDAQLVSGSLTEPLVGAVVMGTPQGRLGRPEEIAATISFLAGEDSSFFVGDTVSPGGGFVTV